MTYSDIKVAIAIKDTTVSRKDLVLWLKTVLRPIPLKELMCMADKLLANAVLSPSIDILNKLESLSDVCDIVVTFPPNPYQEYAKLRESQYQLMLKGAAGDAEAAIAYCKMEAAGEVGHGAMG